MAILKCKMCSGTLDISDNSGIAVCQYCGTKQTIPHLDDEKRIQMFDRANHFRRNHEYDKAMDIFEQILAEDSTDAEAFWSIVLCRFGIDYVEDPKTHRRLPTINRIQSRSIFADDDYKQALNNANLAQKTVYEQEAEEINRIQKEYLKISNEEDPFDIFICYKETDDTGKRTQDSVIANDLYYQLVNEGYKVFFSKITLEGKLGSAYEPYIFSALNSARIMIVLGTKPEYFKAVWVKNEWARFLSMMKDGANKTLIPAYRDMDPYDLPEDFAYLQALDMGKIGFVQDLIRGIKKIFSLKEEKKEVVVETVQTDSGSVDALLKRSYICLEDGDFSKASELLERVLNIDPQNGSAYIAKLMVTHKARTEAGLADATFPLSKSADYRHALDFNGNDVAARLERYESQILEKNSQHIGNVIDELISKIENEIISIRGQIRHANSAIEQADKDYEYEDSWQNRLLEEKKASSKRGCIFGLLGLGFLAIMLIFSFRSCGLGPDEQISVGRGFVQLIIGFIGCGVIATFSGKAWDGEKAVQASKDKQKQLEDLKVSKRNEIQNLEVQIKKLELKIERIKKDREKIVSDLLKEDRSKITVSEVDS